MSLLHQLGAFAGVAGLALAGAVAPASAAAGLDTGAAYCSRPETVIMLDGSISASYSTFLAEIEVAKAAAGQLMNCPEPPHLSLTVFNQAPSTLVPMTPEVTRQLDEQRGQLPQGWSDPLRAADVLRGRMPGAAILLIMDPYVEPGPYDGPPVDAAEYVRKLSRLAEDGPLTVWAVSPPVELSFAGVWSAINSEGLGGILGADSTPFRIEPARSIQVASSVEADVTKQVAPGLPETYDTSPSVNEVSTVDTQSEGGSNSLLYVLAGSALIILTACILVVQRRAQNREAALPDPAEVLQVRSPRGISSEVIKRDETRELVADDGSKVTVRNTGRGLVASTGTRSITLDRAKVTAPAKGLELRTRAPGDRLYQSWAETATVQQPEDVNNLYWNSL